MWTESSVRPVLPTQFVRTRWQSKYGMLKSLLANKRSVRRMCASDDDCCSALHDQDLSDAEWQIIEVSVCFQSSLGYHLIYWFELTGIITNFPTLSWDLEAARGWELCAVFDILGCSLWCGRDDCSSCSRFCAYCSPSTSDAWWSFQQESDFGEVAFQCFACFDDTAGSKVDRWYDAIHSLFAVMHCVVLCLQMACASRCETYSGSMEQSEISLSPLCAAVLSEQLHAACLCSTQWQCPHQAGGTETGNRRIAICRCRYASSFSISTASTLWKQSPASWHARWTDRKRKEDMSTGRPPAIDMDGDMQVEEKKEVKEDARCAVGTGTLV